MSDLSFRWSLIYKSDEYKRFKRIVRSRDEYSCQHCGAKSKRTNRLCVHHIKPKAKFINLIFQVDNGIVLCTTCHINEHARMHESGEDYYAEPSATLPDLKEFVSTLSFTSYNKRRKKKKTKKYVYNKRRGKRK